MYSARVFLLICPRFAPVLHMCYESVVRELTSFTRRLVNMVQLLRMIVHPRVCDSLTRAIGTNCIYCERMVSRDFAHDT